MINIAIDGPAGAGKSTLAKKLADTLGFIYVDTGALYRAVGLYAVRNGTDPHDGAGVSGLLPGLDVRLLHAEGGQQVFLNGEDVTLLIHTPEISMAASAVSAIPAVRSFLLNLQKQIAAKNNVIMDGRDIGTVVLPNAQLKIFLCATPEDRAMRRYQEMQEKGIAGSYEDVLQDVLKRDRQDSTRDIAPLKPADDAVIVDTTGFEFEKSFHRLLAICQKAIERQPSLLYGKDS